MTLRFYRTVEYFNISAHIEHIFLILPLITGYAFDFETANTHHGMIKVNHYGVKGRICNIFWGDEEAKAFCRKKGYPDGIAYHYSVTYNYMPLQSRGPFWVSAMNCTGRENGLDTCPYNTRLDLGNCSRADIASAICLNETSGMYIEYPLHPLPLFVCLYLCSCFYPLKVQTRCPGHTHISCLSCLSRIVS